MGNYYKIACYFLVRIDLVPQKPPEVTLLNCFNNKELAYQTALLSQLLELTKHANNWSLSVLAAKRDSILKHIRSLPEEASSEEKYDHLFSRKKGLFDGLCNRLFEVHYLNPELDGDDHAEVNDDCIQDGMDAMSYDIQKEKKRLTSILEDEGVDLEDSNGEDDDEEEEEDDLDDDDDDDLEDDAEEDLGDDDENPIAISDVENETEDDFENHAKRPFPVDDEEEDELDELNDEDDDQTSKRRRG
ncbi:hypothetical protein DM01DRAFT_1336787, partial [Hesseltinella vesiculosa]